jgi:hypothetical protein
MFTMDNTEGFTPAQISQLNIALDALIAEGWEEKAASDALNNAWDEDTQTADKLHAAVTKAKRS